MSATIWRRDGDGFFIFTKDGKVKTRFADAGEMADMHCRIMDFLDEMQDREEAEENLLRCNCGAAGDPGSCGHHPDCPMREIEG